MRKFSGFNPRQMELIYKRLGYNGPVEGFQGYLDQTPDKAAKLARMKERARQHVEGPNQANMGPVGKAPPDNQMMVQGGKVVTPQAPLGAIPQQDQQQMAGMPVQPQQAPRNGVLPNQMNNQMPQPTNPLSINPVNPAMPMWSTLPEGDIPQPQETFPLQKPSTEIQYMAEGGDVKKKNWDKPIKEVDDPLTRRAIDKPEKLITPVKAAPVKEKKSQFIKKDSGQVKHTATVKDVAEGDFTAAQAAKPTDAHTIDTATTKKGVTREAMRMEAEQGEVSDKAQVEAATALPSSDATVQGQLTKLMQQFEGGETPPWAAGAMRMANTVMASRGLGASSMAGAAITQAAMESAINIAVQDASTFSQFEMQNLNNRQQARLQNAQAFLQMDIANLNNRQQTEMFKSQAVIQSLFTDKAAENATRQFNATSQNQTDQFFANLKTQVSTFNSAQKNAMSMFNAEQGNAVKMFNTQQMNAMKQFNAQNRLIIDQANAQWRQQIATINNAATNNANMQNAQLATGLTMAGFNNYWQQERDLMAYAFTAAENATQRAHEILLAKMGVDLQEDLADQQSRDGLMAAAGSFLANIMDGVF